MRACDAASRSPGSRAGWSCRPVIAVVLALLVAASARPSLAASSQQGTIVLSVRDPSAAPVPYAGLYYGDPASGVTTLVTADPAGRFTLTVGAAAWTVCAYAPLHPGQAGCIGPLTVTPGASRSVDLPLTTVTTSADAVPGEIVVTVRDATGRRVPYAEIPYRYGNYLSINYADAQGRRILQGARDRPAIVCARTVKAAGNRQAGCIGPIGFVPGVTIAVDLPLHVIPADPTDRTGTITGRVLLASSGAPIPGATVKLIGLGQAFGPSADGSFLFGGLQAGNATGPGQSYTVQLQPPAGYATVGPPTRRITILPNETTTVDFLIQPAFVPYWVQSFVPATVEWSGSDGGAVAFGVRPQWTIFLVVARQETSRLFVFDPSTSNYAWIDARSVGPSGPPPGYGS